MTEPTENKKQPVAEPLLPAGWGVPQAFRDRLGDEAGRQRLMEADGHLLLVLHAPPRAGDPYRRGRLFWRSDAGLWKPQSLTHDKHAVGELIDEYEALANEIENQHNDSSTAEDYFAILTALNPLVRATHNLYDVVQEARQAAPDDRKLILLRDRVYSLTRRLELLQQDSKNTLDFVVARRAEQQAESARGQARAAHRLNLLAALFFPLATLTSLFSVQFAHGLESFDAANAPLPFVALVAVGLMLGAVLAAFIGRK